MQLTNKYCLLVACAVILFPGGLLKSQSAGDVSIGSHFLGKFFLSVLDITGKNEKGAVRGTRFFPGNWSKGILIDLNGNQMVDSSSRLIYDKKEGKLFLKDRRGADSVVIELYSEQIKSFVIEDQEGVTHTFVKQSLLSNKGKGKTFFELLLNENGVQLLKQIDTRLIKANLNDIHQGELHDEKFDFYKDDNTFFITYPDSSYRQIRLSRKSIQSVLGPAYALQFSNLKEVGNKTEEQILKELVISFVQERKP